VRLRTRSPRRRSPRIRRRIDTRSGRCCRTSLRPSHWGAACSRSCTSRSARRRSAGSNPRCTRAARSGIRPRPSWRCRRPPPNPSRCPAHPRERRTTRYRGGRPSPNRRWNPGFQPPRRGRRLRPTRVG
jgi:hypothetical protein